MNMKHITVATIIALTSLISVCSDALTITVSNKTDTNFSDIEIISFPVRITSGPISAKQTVTLPTEKSDKLKGRSGYVYFVTYNDRKSCGLIPFENDTIITAESNASNPFICHYEKAISMKSDIRQEEG